MKCRVCVGVEGWVKNPRGGRRGRLDIGSGGGGRVVTCVKVLLQQDVPHGNF